MRGPCALSIKNAKCCPPGSEPGMTASVKFYKSPARIRRSGGLAPFPLRQLP